MNFLFLETNFSVHMFRCQMLMWEIRTEQASCAVSQNADFCLLFCVINIRKAGFWCWKLLKMWLCLWYAEVIKSEEYVFIWLLSHCAKIIWSLIWIIKKKTHLLNMLKWDMNILESVLYFRWIRGFKIGWFWV